MNKEELKALIGKYIHIIFTLYSKKLKTHGYFELYGAILTVEDKNILFKDNYNHEFIVSISKIKSATVETEQRRTEEEARKLTIKPAKKEKQPKEIDKEPLITLNN